MNKRIALIILITAPLFVLMGVSCADVENWLLGYRLEILSPTDGAELRQDNPPSVPLQLQIRGWAEEKLQEGAYLYIEVSGVKAAEWTAYGSKPSGQVTLTEPGRHTLRVAMPLLEGSELEDSIHVTWVKPAPLDKLAGAVTGLVGSGSNDPTTGYLFLFLIGEIALALIGSSIGGGLGAQFFMLIGVAVAIVTLSQTPQGQAALWVIVLGVVGYFFLRLMFNFRFFGWREDSGMAMGFTEDIAPAAVQIAQRSIPQLPAPSPHESLPSRTPGWVRFLRGGGDD